jgi:hypothetical protein
MEQQNRATVVNEEVFEILVPSNLLNRGEGFYVDTSWKHLINSRKRKRPARGLWHEMPFPARTLGSWIRISLEAWAYVCVFYSPLCFPVGRSLETGQSTVKGIPQTLQDLKFSD